MTTAVDPDAPWQTRGACAGAPDPDMWFPGPGHKDRAVRALAVCRRCPVQPECLADTLSMPSGLRAVGMVRGGRHWAARGGTNNHKTVTEGARA